MHSLTYSYFFFFNDTATTEIYTLSLHDALPIFGPSEGDHLFNNLRNGIRLGANRACARNAPERAHAALDPLNFFARQKFVARVDQHDRAVAHDRLAFARVIKRNDGDLFRVDVEPNVEFRPVGQRKNANAFRSFDARVEKIPKLRALVFGIPLALRIAKRINALLGAGFFFITPRAAESGVEPSGRKRIEQSFRFQQAAASLRAERKRIGAARERLAVLMHDELRADFTRVGIAKLDHFREFVTGVDVQQRKGNFPRVKGFLRQAQHDRGIFADRI